ncbi:MAG: chemotaxis protein CheW [Oscillospiraceae bacterium]
MSSENNVEMQERSDDLEGRYLTFFIDDITYGVELLHVLEIIGVQMITKTPGVPYYIKGIINLRGKIVPVVDVRLKLGQPEKEYDERTCIIVVNISDVSVGLIVDRVSEVVSVNDDMLSPPPESGDGIRCQILQSIAKIGNSIVLNIDIEKMFEGELSGVIIK